MSNLIRNKTYFFLTPSIFEVASKNLSNNSSKFLLKSVMIKLLHQEKIKPHIVFFLSDEIDNIKRDFGDNFDSLLQIGENMFYPEYNPMIRGKVNNRILSYATDKDGEILEEDKVKIVCADINTEQFFKAQISEHSFPVEYISIDEALEELTNIEQELKNGCCYVEDSEKSTTSPSQLTQPIY
jgi:hypothetical protein